jgi:dienelactone hydrolase
VPHAVRVFGGARHAVTVRGSEDYDLAADRASRDALEDFLEDRF